MAVLPKHTDRNPRYDPDEDLTLDQLHRFTRAANKAQKKREVLDENNTPSIIEVARRARRASLKKSESKPGKPKKINSTRYALWMVVIAIAALATMYLSQ